jgi:hypothetical protein
VEAAASPSRWVVGCNATRARWRTNIPRGKRTENVVKNHTEKKVQPKIVVFLEIRGQK